MKDVASAAAVAVAMARTMAGSTQESVTGNVFDPLVKDQLSYKQNYVNMPSDKHESEHIVDNDHDNNAGNADNANPDKNVNAQPEEEEEDQQTQHM